MKRESERERNVPFTQVCQSFGSERVVVVLPRELSLDESFGGEGLHGLDDLEVGHVELFVFRRVVVLFGDHHALYVRTKQKQVDSDYGFGSEYGNGWTYP